MLFRQMLALDTRTTTEGYAAPSDDLDHDAFMARLVTQRANTHRSILTSAL